MNLTIRWLSLALLSILVALGSADKGHDTLAVAFFVLSGIQALYGWQSWRGRKT